MSKLPPAVAVVSDDVSLYVTTRAFPMYDEVRAYHQGYLVPTFAANEVEDVELWEARLKDQHDDGELRFLGSDVGSNCEFSVALLIRSDGAVLGGASHEVYLNSRCALISYMVVSPELRGRGAAKMLVDAVFANGEAIVQETTHQPLAAVVIEVLQVRDDHDEEHGPDSDGHHVEASSSKTFRSADRQIIFRRIGFQPVDLDFVHPGKLKGHRYNIGVASRSLDLSGGHFPADVLLAFVEGLVMGILADEGSTDDAEMQQWRELLSGREWVSVGDVNWR